ncbi:MAG: sulfotransferase, partial [Methylovulum sp.]|nr:sulfotransferase [Methylovulum sp.]
MNHLPSFLCIGVQKAGTSWLYEQIRRHPGIWLPPIKELHYFDHLYCPDNRAWTGWHIEQAVKNMLKDYLNHTNSVDFRYVRYLATMACKPLFTEEWYRQAFQRQAAKGKLLGDITPEYCAIGDEGIAYVKRFLGAVNIIWLIRDPVDRALSQLRMNAERRGCSGNEPEAVWLDWDKDPDIAHRGNYADYIPRWEKQFGRERMLFLPFQHIA